LAELQVSTSGTDADCKVIDVFLMMNRKLWSSTLFKMSNYHMMVRSEVMRGRFRNSFSKPEPLLLIRKQL
jgi:hypothetical protein